MQIVIDISDEDYNDITLTGENTVNLCVLLSLRKAVRDGTPLPKGHGNIYDENDIKRGIENPYQCQTVLNGLKLIKPILGADMEGSDAYNN